MRDIKRIKRIVHKLEKLWISKPDLRLGQLLINYIFESENMFYQDDDDTELILDTLVSRSEICLK